MMLTNTVRFLLASVAVGVALVACSLGEQPTPRAAAAQKGPKQKKTAPADEPTPPDTPNGHARPVTRVAFSPDGKTLAALVVEQTMGVQGVALWDLSTGKNIANLKNLNFLVPHVTFYSDGKTLLIWGENSPFNRYDLPSGKSLDPGFATYSPDGQIAVVQGNIAGKKPSAPLARELTRPFDASSGQNSFTLTGAQSGHNVSFSQDGKTLAVRGEDLSIMVWDVVSSKNTANFPQSYGRPWFGLSPDGKILAVQEFKKSKSKLVTAPDISDAVVALFDVAEGKEIGTLEADQTGGPPHQVVFSPDSKTVTAEFDIRSTRTNSYFVRVWNATTAKKLAPLQKSPAIIRKPVVFSPDSKNLAGLCEDQKIRVWDFSSGKITAVLALPLKHEHAEAGACFPAFSPDGKSLAVGCTDGTVKLWTLPPDPKGEVAMSFGPADFPVAEGPKLELKPIPDGYTVQFQGTAVFLRDAKGNKKPMPDGDYRMPNGAIIRVLGGQKRATKF
jgi:WD40 repeat protein